MIDPRAPHTGEFGDFLRLDSATLAPETVDGVHFEEVATYVVHFDVTEHATMDPFGTKKYRGGKVACRDPAFVFCGVRVEEISAFEDCIFSLLPNEAGFAFDIWAVIDPIKSKKAGIEGRMIYRYVRLPTGAPRPNGASDGYTLSSIKRGRGFWFDRHLQTGAVP